MYAHAASYGNFLLCDYNDAVGTPDPHRRQAALGDGFKGIFCEGEERSRLGFKEIRGSASDVTHGRPDETF